jgi:hypothetical protein
MVGFMPSQSKTQLEKLFFWEALRLCWEFAFGANVVKFYSEQVFDPDIHRRGRDEGA